MNHTFTDMYQLIEGGRAGMFRVGDWNVKKWDARAIKGDFVSGPWPKFSANRENAVVIGGMRGIAVPENSPKKALAMEFAQFMLTKPAQQASLELLGAAVRKDLDTSTLSERQRYFAEAKHKLVAYDFPESVHAWYPELEAAYHRKLMTALANPPKDVKAFIAETAKEMRELKAKLRREVTCGNGLRRAPRRTEAYDGQTAVIHGIDLEIEDGEFMVLVGPSGCGKIDAAADDRGARGDHRRRDLDRRRGHQRAATAQRDIAMVFQDYALYPHMTVCENMGFGLRMRGTPKPEIERRVDDAADMLRLEPAARPQAGEALRRPAPAGRDGPRDRPRAQGLSHRRAALQPRRQAARRDARRDQASCTSAWAPRSSTSPTTRSRR